MAYKLKLDDQTTVTLRGPVKTYLEFVERPGSYIEIKKDLVVVRGDVVTITKPEYLSQVSDFFGNRLSLHRGMTRQHPLWYQVRFMHLVVPLGTGELPSWGTSESSFIPFGFGYREAEKVAHGKAGMGPGDDRTMLADYDVMCAAEGPVDVGMVIRADIGPRDRVTFYNTGEIQVRGPLVDVSLTTVGVPTSALDAPSPADERQDYLLRHGELCHARTVKALRESVNGWNRLEAITTRSTRRAHAAQLMAMRRTSQQVIPALAAELVKNTTGRRAGFTDDAYLLTFLDNCSNRAAHDAYVAAIAGGAGMVEAGEAGVAAAQQWVWSWAERSVAPDVAVIAT